MTDSPFSKWSGQVDLVIRKYAASSQRDEIEDIRQEVMLAFVEVSEELLRLDKKSEDRARALAYTVAKNAVISYTGGGAQKVVRHSISLDDGDVRGAMELVERGHPVDSHHRRFFGGLLSATSQGPPDIDMDRAIGSLTDDEQTVVRGLFFEGRSQEQLAEDLSKTRHWVRLRKQSALAELKRLLKN